VQYQSRLRAGSLLTLFPVHWKDLIVGCFFLSGGLYLLFVSESEEEGKGSTRSGAGEGDLSVGKRSPPAFIVIFNTASS